MFSHKSLLNFDPAPWINVAFKDSPVDIITAQVPNPTWQWAWKSWYVDMSGDVDEEGWAYSLSFSPSFSWHGTHVWFHSFVRRRRWLRKRIKSDGAGSVASPRPSVDGPSRITSPIRKSFQSERNGSDDLGRVDENLDKPFLVGENRPIAPIEQLIGQLDLARLDREKLATISQFLDKGHNYQEFSLRVSH
jgi:hypothetical protein